MLAERFNTLRAWLLDVHQPSSVGMMTDHRFDLGNFATQRERHVDRLPLDDGDAVAKMADVIDTEALNHGALRGRIRCCRRRP
jgi:hypothetical protein